MTPYKNAESGIVGFDYGETWIRIQFNDDNVYEYRLPFISTQQLEHMKQFADKGRGLNTYLTQNRDIYDNGTLVT